MATKPDIFEMKKFAYELFMQTTKTGRHKFSFAKIIIQIRLKFGKKYDRDTIQIWSKKDNWKADFEKAKQVGIEKAVIADQSERDVFINSLSEDVKKNYLAYDWAREVGQSVLLSLLGNPNNPDAEPCIISEQAALKLFEMGIKGIQTMRGEASERLDLTTKGEAINKINYIVKDEKQKQILNDL
jgi:hypothetical protein